MKCKSFFYKIFRNNLKNKKKTIEKPKEEKKEEQLFDKKKGKVEKFEEPSLKESDYSESFKELQKELLDDSKE